MGKVVGSDQGEVVPNHVDGLHGDPVGVGDGGVNWGGFGVQARPWGERVGS